MSTSKDVVTCVKFSATDVDIIVIVFAATGTHVNLISTISIGSGPRFAEQFSSPGNFKYFRLILINSYPLPSRPKIALEIQQTQDNIDVNWKEREKEILPLYLHELRLHRPHTSGVLQIIHPHLHLLLYFVTSAL